MTAATLLSSERAQAVSLSRVNSSISTASKRLLSTVQRRRPFRGAHAMTTSASTPPGSCHTFPDNGFR
jgi:hypothetical protein